MIGRGSFNHVIFDWNGTLIDDIELAVKGVNKVRETQALAAIDRAIYREHFGFPIRGFYEKLGVDLERLSFARLGEIYLSLFNEGLKSCVLHTGTLEVLDWVKRSGMTVSILSASQRDTLRANLAHAGLAGRVDHVFGLEGSEAEGKLDLARRLDTELGHPGLSALMVGDTDHDFEIAQACGWRVASVSHGHQTAERLSSLHSAVFPDLFSLFEHHFPAIRSEGVM